MVVPVMTTFGTKVRTLRRRSGMTQVELARRLGISASYLNLIEHNRRSLSARLLVLLAQIFQVDLHEFSSEEDAHREQALAELFADPLFEGQEIGDGEVRELASNAPGLARAVLALYHAYRDARYSADDLALQAPDRPGLPLLDGGQLPPEEVGALVQRELNYFPELEQAAEELWTVADLGGDDLGRRLTRHLENAHGVQVELTRPSEMGGAVRRYDPRRKRLQLSETLRAGSRNFQLAHQLGLLTQRETLDAFAADRLLTTPESRALCRVVLANYFAGALVMPYRPFLAAAREERYDIDLLGHRFRTGFEQVCHRLTTLRRRGEEGVPFHMVRVDVAGNISKRFSASGMHVPRFFSGACPRWSVFGAFQTPGMTRVQLSRMPDGAVYFSVARTIGKDTVGYHAPRRPLAIELGCAVEHASQLVYADGIDLESADTAVPVGVTCRLCDRSDCEQRVFPALHQPLLVDENVRGVSFFAPVEPR